MIDYTFIKSKRKSIGITVKPDGSVIVRAPLGCSKKRAEAFVVDKLEWIEKAQRKMAERRAAAGLADEDSRSEAGAFTAQEISRLKKQAKNILPDLVEELARTIGVTYGTVSIRTQKTRWGSCSSKGNLNFNCLLMLFPESVQRYVVVHELCHRKEMNHSAAFWNEVAKYHPSYREDRMQLKEKGCYLLNRLL